MIQVVRSVIGNILLSFIKISVNKVFKKKKSTGIFLMTLIISIKCHKKVSDNLH